VNAKSAINTMIATEELDRYLRQCRVKNSLVEDDHVHVPPSRPEVDELIGHLRTKGLDPMIVGSVGVLYHIGHSKDFRPTVDLDVWVSKDPGVPPTGWKRDPESVGVVSWISPSGGYVDFMTPGHEFPSGEKTPRSLRMHQPSKDTSYPVADVLDLIRLKLNSFRAKDLTDILALAKSIKHVPSNAEIGKLNKTQRDNLELVRQWVANQE